MSRGLNDRHDSGPGHGQPASEPRGAKPAEADARHERVLAEVDRELRARLSEVPSADFEARVLVRIARDEEPRRTSYTWLAAAAALVLAAGLLYALTRSPATDLIVPTQVARPGSDVLLPPLASQPPAAAAPESPRLPPAARLARHGVGRPGPEVIVPLNQMEAVRRLVRAVNEGQIETLPAPADGTPTAPAEIVVEPLKVEPIPVPELDPGEASPQQPNRGA